MLQRVQAILTDLVRDDLKALGLTGPPARRDALSEFVAGGFMGIMLWWLERSPDLSPEEVDGIFRRLVMQGLAAELRP